jgi:nucleoside-diphosphate-sugar epimerase
MDAVRVVLTGAAGFIGQHCATALLAEGHDVVAVDRRPWPGAPTDPRLSVVQGDLADLDLGSLLEGADALVHLAGRPGTHDSWTDYSDYLRDNVECVHRLAQACDAVGVIRVVHASSSSVYGAVALPGEKVLAPVSPYGVSKLAGDLTWAAHAASSPLEVVTVRLFSVYGPGQRPDMGIRRAIDAMVGGSPFTLYGSGDQTRSLTYVTDAVAALVRALHHGVPGRTYDIGGERVVSMRDVLVTLRDLGGTLLALAPVPDPPGNQQATEAETSPARDDLGWVPLVGLAEGLAAQVAWQRGLSRPASGGGGHAEVG